MRARIKLTTAPLLQTPEGKLPQSGGFAKLTNSTLNEDQDRDIACTFFYTSANIALIPP